MDDCLEIRHYRQSLNIVDSREFLQREILQRKFL